MVLAVTGTVVAMLTLIPASAAPVGTPVGRVDSVTVGSRAGEVRVQGWAIDPDAREQAVPVRVSVDGAPSKIFTANQNRPDVGRFYTQSGPDHGFDATVYAGFGEHQICVTANNLVGNHPDGDLKCHRITVRDTRPIGRVDRVVELDGMVRVVGWAVDGQDLTEPLAVEVSVDDEVVRTILANRIRRDVGAVLPIVGDRHGFSHLVKVPPGEHLVCMRAFDSAGDNRPIGCGMVEMD